MWSDCGVGLQRPKGVLKPGESPPNGVRAVLRVVEKMAQDGGLLSFVRENIIGYNRCFTSPFGVRRITYADYTASGRSLKCVEDFIREEVLPTYGNTHTSTSLCGHQTMLYREEAREMIANAVNAGKDDVGELQATVSRAMSICFVSDCVPASLVCRLWCFWSDHASCSRFEPSGEDGKWRQGCCPCWSF